MWKASHPVRIKVVMPIIYKSIRLINIYLVYLKGKKYCQETKIQRKMI